MGDPAAAAKRVRGCRLNYWNSSSIPDGQETPANNADRWSRRFTADAASIPGREFIFRRQILKEMVFSRSRQDQRSEDEEYMAQLTSRERILRTLRREPVDRVPISTYEMSGYHWD